MRAAHLSGAERHPGAARAAAAGRRADCLQKYIRTYIVLTMRLPAPPAYLRDIS